MPSTRDKILECFEAWDVQKTGTISKENAKKLFEQDCGLDPHGIDDVLNLINEGDYLLYSVQICSGALSTPSPT